jgi:hypothetical protein
MQKAHVIIISTGLGVVTSDIPCLAYHIPTRLRFNNIDHSHATYVQESAIGGVMHMDLGRMKAMGMQERTQLVNNLKVASETNVSADLRVN